MMGLSYGGYFSLMTAAADKRIKSIYAAGFFNDRSKICFDDWKYNDSLNTFCDAEIAALCAPRPAEEDLRDSAQLVLARAQSFSALRRARLWRRIGGIASLLGAALAGAAVALLIR